MPLFNLTIDAPAGSEVAITGKAGRKIGTHKVGANGRAVIRAVPCSPGETLRAEVVRYGRVIAGSTVIDPDAVDDDEEAADVTDAYDSQLRASQRYRYIVEELAAGGSFDREYLEAALELAERSEDELWVDVALEQQQIEAAAAYAADYEVLVEHVANGGNYIEFQDAGGVRARANKSFDDLLADVEIMRFLWHDNERLGITS